jgi:DNA-binding MarR family transcriptional regulator
MENTAIEIVKDLKIIMDLIGKTVKKEFYDMNLTNSQVLMIGILSHNKEMRIGDLSKEMGLSNSTVSGIVDKLEENELIERIRIKEDRRVIKVRLKESFKKNAKKKYNEVEKKLTKIINKSSKEDLDFILKGLKNLKIILQEEIAKN